MSPILSVLLSTFIDPTLIPSLVLLSSLEVFLILPHIVKTCVNNFFINLSLVALDSVIQVSGSLWGQI